MNLERDETVHLYKFYEDFCSFFEYLWILQYYIVSDVIIDAIDITILNLLLDKTAEQPEKFLFYLNQNQLLPINTVQKIRLKLGDENM